jgi:Smg protein
MRGWHEGAGLLASKSAMDNSVFDILVYVFDRYLLEDLPAAAERDTIARDLENAGFGGASVERALDWLADLADVRERASLPADGRSFRIYSEEEQARIGTGGRGMLSSLEASGILGPDQREIVIDRLLALDSEEIGIEQVKWVVLMVLSSQPDQEQAYARMEDLVFDLPGQVPH